MPQATPRKTAGSAAEPKPLTYVNLPLSLVQKIDRLSKKDYQSNRALTIRALLSQALSSQPQDSKPAVRRAKK